MDSARQEGFHVLPFAISPECWTVADLEDVLRLAYGYLPATQPEWPEVGLLSRPEHSARSDPYSLIVERGDYAATIRLPKFPVRAVLGWFDERTCELDLKQQVDRLQSDEAAVGKSPASVPHAARVCAFTERSR